MNMGLGFNNNNHKVYKCVNVKDDMHNRPLFIKDFCCSDFLFSIQLRHLIKQVPLSSLCINDYCL